LTALIVNTLEEYSPFVTTVKQLVPLVKCTKKQVTKPKECIEFLVGYFPSYYQHTLAQIVAYPSDPSINPREN
jgi:hypothetical protein